jgi:hypothetical protein
VQFVAHQVTRYERADVVWPEASEQRGRVSVNEDDDIVAVLRSLWVLT